MADEDKLRELAIAVARLSDSVAVTAQVLKTLCERLAIEPEQPTRALACIERPPTTLQLVQGGRSISAAPPPAASLPD
jgi:hypothetical protein